MTDPEIPVLTVGDLGVLREVVEEGGRIVVTLTPTYSGCPAMEQIASDVRDSLRVEGYPDVEVRFTQSPPWSTDWISDEGRDKLARFGIAPPTAEAEVRCPRCAEGSPRMISRFGSTACKALMVCSACGEPFDWFKEH